MYNHLVLHCDDPLGRDGTHLEHVALALAQHVDDGAGVLLGQLHVDQLERLAPLAADLLLKHLRTEKERSLGSITTYTYLHPSIYNEHIHIYTYDNIYIYIYTHTYPDRAPVDGRKISGVNIFTDVYIYIHTYLSIDLSIHVRQLERLAPLAADLLKHLMTEGTQCLCQKHVYIYIYIYIYIYTYIYIDRSIKRSDVILFSRTLQGEEPLDTGGGRVFSLDTTYGLLATRVNPSN